MGISQMATDELMLRRRERTRTAVLIVLLAVLSSSIAQAQKPGAWTGWMTTNDPLVQWRFRTISWGKSMSPDCDLQFRIDGEGAANFHWYVTYDLPDDSGAGPTGH